jgi:Tfp pilus assembly pilus retraction ATPase PilT
MSAAVMSNIHREVQDAQESTSYSVPGLGRFRVNVFQQRGTVGLVLGHPDGHRHHRRSACPSLKKVAARKRLVRDFHDRRQERRSQR